MSGSIVIKWGGVRHTYPCTPATAKAAREIYRQERARDKKFPRFAPLGGKPEQRQHARDQAAHFVLVMGLP